MAKAKRKKSQKTTARTKAAGKEAAPAAPDAGVGGLWKAAGEAKDKLEKAEAEARKLEEQATAMVQEAKRAYPPCGG